jgi:hypothetical protein
LRDHTIFFKQTRLPVLNRSVGGRSKVGYLDRKLGLRRHNAHTHISSVLQSKLSSVPHTTLMVLILINAIYDYTNGLGHSKTLLQKIDVTGGEHDAFKIYVSEVNLITQGISPCRDGVYPPRKTHRDRGK